MDAEHQQPHPPGVDREQDAHFLNRVDTALDRHRKTSEPPPPNVHEMVIHTQAPTPDANAGIGSPAVATAPAGGAKQDTLPKPAGSAAAPQFFGAGGPMCVVPWIVRLHLICRFRGQQDASIRRVNTPKSQGIAAL
jgi:hypothetical protein